MDSKIIENNFGFLIADVARLMRKRFSHRARDVDLTGAQWRVLAYLARMPGVNQAKLADFLDVEPITLTRLIDRMEASGIVRREIDPNDRRARIIYMTDKAAPVMEELRKVSVIFQSAVFAGIPEGDLEVTKSVIAAVRKNLLELDCVDSC